jgi:hypothetical protein
MRIDFYTKVVLTVIAVSLAWIAVGGPSLFPAVQAQGNAVQNVRIVGWGNGSSTVADVQVVGWRAPLPLPVIPKPD